MRKETLASLMSEEEFLAVINKKIGDISDIIREGLQENLEPGAVLLTFLASQAALIESVNDNIASLLRAGLLPADTAESLALQVSKIGATMMTSIMQHFAKAQGVADTFAAPASNQVH